ncbi:MAG: M56 family metallopeptidase [Pyrinomonadaceae bacterium]|nr:M56 family metallopeptidase [Pyrinomonadaceae bacterium]
MQTINQLVPIFLLNALWQGMILCATSLLCERAIRNLVAARYQHLLWVMALVLMLGLPLWSLRPAGTYERSMATYSASGIAEPGSDQTTAKPTRTVSSNGISTTGLTSLLQNQRYPFSYPPFVAWVLIGCYMLFILCRLIKLWSAWQRTNAIRQSAFGRLVPVLMATVVTRCGQAMRLKDVVVLCSPVVRSPVTLGHFRPLIILPEHLFQETSAGVLASAISHEMAHIRRRDFLLNLLYEILYLPVSFHPAAWLVRRRITQTRELACDEMVTEQMVEPIIYARSLVQLAASATTFNCPDYTLGVFDACILEERIMRLTNETKRASVRLKRTLLLVATLVIGVTSVAVAAFSFRIENGASATVNEAQNSIVGTWQGTWNGNFPAMTLRIKANGDKLSGTIVFYRSVKTDSGLKVDGQTDELPLIEPSFDGKTLLFKVIRSKSKEAVEFEMKITGNDEAEAWNVGVIDGNTITVKLKRETVALSSSSRRGQDKSSAGAVPRSIVVGTWYLHFYGSEGKEAEGPNLTLAVKADGDKLTGTAVTWKEDVPGQGWQKVEWPLVEPRFDGSAFSFKVSNGEEMLAAELKLVGEKFEGEWKSSKTMQSGRMKLIKKE